MNVLFLTHSYPRFATDPVGSFVLRLAVALRDEGVFVHVVAPSAPGLARREELEGIPVERYRYAPRGRETLAYTGAMQSMVRDSWSARAALGGLVASGFVAALGAARRWRPAAIHAHWWFPGGLTGSGVSALRGVPLVTTLHGSDLRVARGGAVAQRLFAHVARRSSVLTTVSTWLADEARRLAPGADPVVGPMPVATAAFTLRQTTVREQLLFVGKLNEQKGIVPLLHALTKMRHTPKLDIVVGVGSEEGPTRQLARQLGVEGQLRWFPLLEQPKLAERYRCATALVVPAIDEGLGMTAIEAQLSGTPVVAFASGGLTDIIEDGRTGFLVPPRDVDALAATLDCLLDMPDQGAALGVTGREHALALFSPAAVARRYVDIYGRARGARQG